eukprot:21287-Heterococcus_DN1.PRE.1
MDPKGDAEKAKALLASCSLRAAQQQERNKPNPSEPVTAADMVLHNKYGKKLFGGYAFSLLGGVSIARWLAKRGISGYRPGAKGQLCITVLATVLGGKAYGASLTKPMLLEMASTPLGKKMACAGALEMGPCVQDPTCRQLLDSGPGKFGLQMYEYNRVTVAHQAAIMQACDPSTGEPL